jgi:hypothetical protein
MVFTVKHKTFEQDVGKFDGGVLKCIEHKTKNFLIILKRYLVIFQIFLFQKNAKTCTKVHKENYTRLYRVS